jgi:hypothetical protein
MQFIPEIKEIKCMQIVPYPSVYNMPHTSFTNGKNTKGNIHLAKQIISHAHSNCCTILSYIPTLASSLPGAVYVVSICIVCCQWSVSVLVTCSETVSRIMIIRDKSNISHIMAGVILVSFRHNSNS